VQVSVIDPSATASDALSNVVFVGTPEESVMRLAKSAPEARALIVSVGSKRARCTAIRWGVRVDAGRCDVTASP
jgi:thiamine biosynthesis lipoprotein